MKLTAENRSQKIHSKQVVDQLSSAMIGAIVISSPPEDTTNIYRDDHLVFLLQKLEEDEVQNLEEK